MLVSGQKGEQMNKPIEFQKITGIPADEVHRLWTTPLVELPPSTFIRLTDAATLAANQVCGFTPQQIIWGKRPVGNGDAKVAGLVGRTVKAVLFYSE